MQAPATAPVQGYTGRPRACGGIGRRARLRALWTEWSVEVRVLSGALGKPRTAGLFSCLDRSRSPSCRPLPWELASSPSTARWTTMLLHAGRDGTNRGGEPHRCDRDEAEFTSDCRCDPRDRDRRLRLLPLPTSLALGQDQATPISAPHPTRGVNSQPAPQDQFSTGLDSRASGQPHSTAAQAPLAAWVMA